MKIVFFGDSITDSNRNYSDPEDLGDGYVSMVEKRLRLLNPQNPPKVINHGVGGNRTEHLLERIDRDVVNESPDVVVLYIGINDVWHGVDNGNLISPEQFRENYLSLVTTIRGTGAKLILIQPYVLPVGGMGRLRVHLDPYLKIISDIAAQERLPLIRLDEIFRGVTQDIPPAQFSADGIHPTHRGCRYIADLVMKELKAESKRLLVVIDMQNDFVNGTLGTAEAQKIIPEVSALISRERADGTTEVVFTQDTHSGNYLSTQEGKLLPVLHCLRGTKGWELVKGLSAQAEGARVFEKDAFSSVPLAEYARKNRYDEITLCGLCTDVCVISNALLLKAFCPETEIKVSASACAGTSAEAHKTALEAMKNCQITVE